MTTVEFIISFLIALTIFLALAIVGSYNDCRHYGFSSSQCIGYIAIGSKLERKEK